MEVNKIVDKLRGSKFIYTQAEKIRSKIKKTVEKDGRQILRNEIARAAEIPQNADVSKALSHLAENIK